MAPAEAVLSVQSVLQSKQREMNVTCLSLGFRKVASERASCTAALARMPSVVLSMKSLVILGRGGQVPLARTL